MGKYLLELRYTTEGINGVLASGGTAREAAGRAAVESVGGTLDAIYFGFGATDVYAIADLPSNAAAAAVAMKVSASGAAAVRTVVLLTPSEVDEACRQEVSYRPPGS